FCLSCSVVYAGCTSFLSVFFTFFLQAEDGIRDATVTGVQTCALPICAGRPRGVRGEDGGTGVQAGRAAGEVPPVPFRPDGRPSEIGRASCRERVERRGGGEINEEKQY